MKLFLARLGLLLAGCLFAWAALVLRARGEPAAPWVFTAGFVVAFAPWLVRGRGE